MIKRLPFFLLLIALLGVIWKYFKEVIKAPDQYLFNPWGDAVKSYYCSAFYIRYNSDLRFTGMNYPFGESLLYTDGQPLLAELLRIWHGLAALPNYGVGILNLLIIGSLFITGIVVYCIARHLRLPQYYAAAVALIITFLSPQLFRFTDHLSLSYAFIVPVLWWLVIQLFATRNPGYMAAYILFTLLMGCIHPYVIVISAIFLLAYVLVYTLQNPRRIKGQWGFLAAAAATAVLPLVLFNVAIALSDPIIDRPTDPYGFFAYHSTFSSVFFPVSGPLQPAFQQLVKTGEQIWEGYAYVGLAGLLCLILTLVKAGRYLLRSLRRRNWHGVRLLVRPALPPPLRTGLWAALLILVFSFCIPFKYEPFRWIPDMLPPLKQFRALGRFAWIFYYVFTLYAAYYFYQLYRYLALRGAAAFGISLLALLLFAWAVEAHITVKAPSDTIKARREAHRFIADEGNYKELLANARQSPAGFQAILPLPFFHIGSEVFWIDGTGRAQTEAMKASFNTGLPIAAVMMGRTSLSHTVQLIQLLGHPVLPKPLAHNLPDKKPLLVLYTKEGLTENEQYLLSKAELVAENEAVALYSLPVSAFTSTAGQQLAQFQQIKEQLTPVGDLLLSENRQDVVFEKYSGQSGVAWFLDAGSVTQKTGPLVLYSGGIPAATDTSQYEMSVWYYIPGGSAPEIFIRQFDPEGNQLAVESIGVKRSADIFGKWVRGAGLFKPVRPDIRLEISVAGKNMTADNLLIRPVGCDVYYQSEVLKTVVKNNFPLVAQ